MTQTANLNASSGARLGEVGISEDAIAVGGSTSRGNQVYVFVKPLSGWHDMFQTARLTASDGVKNDGFGAVGISGSTVVVGAPFANIGSNYQQGAAYVFVKPPKGWENMNETAKLTASDGAAYDDFGWTASVSARTVAVGAPFSNQATGSAYVFVEPKDGWKTTSKFSAKLRGDGVRSGDEFAAFMSLDGEVLVLEASLGVPALPAPSTCLGSNRSDRAVRRSF
jgi:hypothetical protein